MLALLHSGVMAARAGLPPGTCSACPPLAFPAWGLDAGQEASLAKLRMEKEKDERYADFTTEERKED